MERDRVLELVRKLLRMTTENGCTVDEAAAAAGRAQRLLTEHRLDVAAVMSNTDEITIDKQELREGQGARPSARQWRCSLLHVVARAQDCSMWVNSHGGYYVLVGTEQQRAVALYLWTYLVREIDAMGRRYMRQWNDANVDLYGRKRGSQLAARSYRLGCVAAIKHRLADEKRKAEASAPDGAMVRVRAEQNALERWLEQNRPFLRYGRRGSVNRAAYAQGQRDGSRIAMRPAVRTETRKERLIS